MTPSLSVCIPAWNAERTLRRTLMSVFEQEGYSPEVIEVVVVDDGSTDRTRELLTSLEGTPGLRVVLNPVNLGATANWERALRLGRGAVATLLHSDDCWAPGLLRVVNDAFTTPELVFFVSGQLYQREDGSVENRNPEWKEGRWTSGEYLEELLALRECPAPSTTFFRASAIAGLHPLYDSRFRWSPERDLYVRLMLANPSGLVRHDGLRLIRRGVGLEQQSVKYPGHAITDTCALFDAHRALYDSPRRESANVEARQLFTSCLLAVVLRKDWKQLADVLRNRPFRGWLSSPRNFAAVAASLTQRSARRLLKGIGLT